MNKQLRGFILVTLALSLGAWLTAQSPSLPGIQGFYYAGKIYKAVGVDKNGNLLVSGGGSSGCPGTVGTPCVVGGSAAAGAAIAGNPVPVGLSDGTDVRYGAGDTSGRAIVTTQAAVGAASGNPFPTGYRDDSGNILADYGFPDQAAVTISSSTDTVMVTGVSSTKTYVGHVSFTLDAAQTVTIQQGTGSTCGTNTLVLYGPSPVVSAIALDFDSKGGLHTTVNARDLCLHLGGSATAGGGIFYGTH